ncbi:MAG: choice-of-anchor X domain-containing protein [Bacteroidota bacterium]
MRQLLLRNNFFLFIIILSLLSISGCEKKYTSIVDSTGNAPIINDASFSVFVVNTDTIYTAGQSLHNPNDTLTIRGIAKVRAISFGDEKEISIVGFSVNGFNFSSSLAEGVLHDDGVSPDAKANDSVYSGYIEFQIQRVVVGTFSINLWSESTGGYKSNTIILPLQVVRSNRPPIISDLIAPDTVDLAIMTEFEISVKVIDPDGQNDIMSVSRFTPSGKILPLHALNDSTYEETVSLTAPPPALGSYLFRFRAVDRSNDSSNVLTHTIVVIKTAAIE